MRTVLHNIDTVNWDCCLQNRRDVRYEMGEKSVAEFPKDTMEIQNKLPEPFNQHTESI
jgi:hypothetical protein